MRSNLLFANDAEAAEAVARKFRLEGIVWSDCDDVVRAFVRYIGPCMTFEFVGDNPTERVLVIQQRGGNAAVVVEDGIITAESGPEAMSQLRRGGFACVRTDCFGYAHA